MKYYMLTLLVALLLQPATAYAAPLTGEQLKSQIIGKKWKWESQGAKGTIRMRRNGSIAVTTNTSIKRDKGSWQIRGNRLCTRFEKLRSGEEACYTYTKSGNRYLLSNGGVLFR